MYDLLLFLMEIVFYNLDNYSRRLLTAAIGLLLLAGYIFTILMERGTLLPLLPVLIVAVLIGIGFWLAHRHYSTAPKPGTQPPSVAAEGAPPDPR
jgi:uncharacterized membrane protein